MSSTSIYSALVCEICGQEFTGRTTTEGADVLCPECVAVEEVPVLRPGDDLPMIIQDEFEDGRGEDE